MMNIKSNMTGMNTCNTMEKYITMASHTTTPNILPSNLATPLPGIPWFMQGFCGVFPPILPVPPMLKHQLFHFATPESPNHTSNHTSKSFLIKDILADNDSTTQKTAQATATYHVSSHRAESSDDKSQQSRHLQSMPPSMFSFYILPTQKERSSYSRARTIFTPAQLNELELKFEQKKYISTPERFHLAKNLGLNPVTIKTWYQNRRMKWKRELQKINPSYKPTRQKGRPPKYLSNDAEDRIIVD